MWLGVLIRCSKQGIKLNKILVWESFGSGDYAQFQALLLSRRGSQQADQEGRSSISYLSTDPIPWRLGILLQQLKQLFQLFVGDVLFFRFVKNSEKVNSGFHHLYTGNQPRSPDFPAPFEAIARRILKQCWPRGVPCSGCFSRLLISDSNSFERELYFFISLLISRLNKGVAITL